MNSKGNNEYNIYIILSIQSQYELLESALFETKKLPEWLVNKTLPKLPCTQRFIGPYFTIWNASEKRETELALWADLWRCCYYTGG